MTLARILRLSQVLILVLSLTAAPWAAPRPTRAAGPWYVAPAGSDGNSCLSAGSPCLTINGAIGKASSGDTIQVATGIYTASTGSEVVLIDKSVTLSGGWDSAFTTQSGMSTIDGEGARQGTTVNSGVTGIIERFVIQHGLGGGITNGGTLTLNNSTVTDNAASDGGGIYNSGTLSITNSAIITNTATNIAGGIYNASGTLMIAQSAVSGNTANGCGGVFNGALLVLTSSTLFSNTATSTGGALCNHNATANLNAVSLIGNTAQSGEGGGLRNFNGIVTIVSSNISGNHAGNSGGGIFNENGGDAVINVISSTLSGNVAAVHGGGLFNSTGIVSVTDSIVMNNIAAMVGGGIYAASIVSGSTIASNTATAGSGGGIAGSGMIINSTVMSNTAALNGGGVDFSGPIVNSTVSNNSAANGGGISAYGMTITNSTVSGNRASNNGGGILSAGTCPFCDNTVKLNNVTLTNNTADSDNNGSGDGGGVHNGASAPVNFRNALIAWNTDEGGEAPDCSGALNSQGYSLIRSTSGCTISGDTTGNLIGVDPVLGSLLDNGGSTLTHALLVGSPAIDAGNPATPGSGGTACETTDQRGVARPQTAACDIGAYELEPPAADLWVSKTSSPDPTYVESPLTYTLMVTNTGELTATGVILTDTLPAGLLFGSASAGCAEVSGTVTCTLDPLTSTASVSLTVVVTPTVPGVVTNTVNVTTVTTETYTVNNTAIRVTLVNPADLVVAKTDWPDPVFVGHSLTYTIVVTNSGPATANGVMLTDTLPLSVTLGPITASQGSCSGTNIIVCNLGTLNNSISATVTMIVTPTSSGAITNMVAVTGLEPDPNIANNSATALTTVAPVADLSILKGGIPDPVNASSTLTYTLSVNNAGPSAATLVTITDTLPAGVVYGSSTGSGWSCSQVSVIVTCTRASLSVGAAPSVTIVVTAPASAGSISNQVSINSVTFDPNTANNSATAMTTVAPVVNLSISQSDSPDPVLVGSPLTYTITVTNNGPSPATGVTLTDTLPSGVTFGLVTPSQGSCSGTSIITCNLGPLNAGLSAHVTVVVTPTAIGTISNTATVTAGEHDPTLADNTTTQNTTVTPYALYLPTIIRGL